MTQNYDILDTSNLSIGYHGNRRSGTIEILSDINLHLTGGKLICLMGPNGIGKSTLIRTLARLQRPLGGQILIHGTDINDISRYEFARQVSVVLTDRVSTGNLNVYELVALGRYPFTSWLMKLTDPDRRAIDEAIAVTGLEGMEEEKLHQLSDGQVQKTMIARALAQEGLLTLLDEPTAHLDLNNRVEIMRLLKQMAHHSGKTILMATHELDLTLQMADRLILTLPDKSIDEGLPEDLILNGRLDAAFQMKGYNLKTGKTEFISKHDLGVHITGSGYQFLWTKNAVERNGYRVFDKDNAPKVIIEILSDRESIAWNVRVDEKIFEASSLEQVLNILKDL